MIIYVFITSCNVRRISYKWIFFLVFVDEVRLLHDVKIVGLPHFYITTKGCFLLEKRNYKLEPKVMVSKAIDSSFVCNGCDSFYSDTTTLRIWINTLKFTTQTKTKSATVEKWFFLYSSRWIFVFYVTEEWSISIYVFFLLFSDMRQ